MSNLTVTLNYSEIASSVIALKNHAKKTIEVCDKIIEVLDKAKVEDERSNPTMDTVS